MGIGAGWLLCYGRGVVSELERTRLHEHDPHDPLEPRADDPRIGRWWSWGRLYRRNRGENAFFRWPAMTILAVVIVSLVGLVYVILTGGM